MLWIMFLNCFSFLLLTVVVDCHSYRYANHQRVDILVNTVGPFNNPTETYPVSYLFTCLFFVRALLN